MLELTRHPMKIAHLNVRSEKHGENEVSCIDIKLRFDLPNTALDEFASGLRVTLYEAADDDAGLLDDSAHITHVRNSDFEFTFAGLYSGVGMHVHSGNGKAKGDLIFPDAKWGKFTVKPLEGGTCSCVSRASVYPSSDEAAKLFGLLHHEVPVSLDLSQAVNGDDAGEDEE